MEEAEASQGAKEAAPAATGATADRVDPARPTAATAAVAAAPAPAPAPAPPKAAASAAAPIRSAESPSTAARAPASPVQPPAGGRATANDSKAAEASGANAGGGSHFTVKSFEEIMAEKAAEKVRRAQAGGQRAQGEEASRHVQGCGVSCHRSGADLSPCARLGQCAGGSRRWRPRSYSAAEAGCGGSRAMVARLQPACRRSRPRRRRMDSPLRWRTLRRRQRRQQQRLPEPCCRRCEAAASERSRVQLDRGALRSGFVADAACAHQQVLILALRMG